VKIEMPNQIWNNFALILPKDWQEDQRREMKRAFYSGMFAFTGLLTQIAELDSDVGADMLEAANTEVRETIEHMIAEDLKRMEVEEQVQ
jgi:hypothetical protein